MGRVLRKGTTLGGVTLLSDAEVSDIWRNDDEFAGWLWNGDNLHLHEADLTSEVVINGVPHTRSYGFNAVVEFAPVVAEPIAEPEPEVVEQKVVEPKKSAKKGK